MTKLTYWTSRPLPQISVAINTLLFPLLNSFMILSLSFWLYSPCITDMVKLFSLIFLPNHSTFFFWLQNITAYVIVRVSYKSHNVSNFHSSSSTATKNYLIPSNVSSSLFTNNLIGWFMNFYVISNISYGRVALSTIHWVECGRYL